jgi:LVIVD repeat
LKRRTHWLVLCVALLTIASLALPTAGLAEHENREYFGPIVDLGHSPAPSGPGPFDNINSDLAFWGSTAYQGNFNGFRIVDLADPANPVQVTDYNNCNGGQGDVMIWDDLLIRTWDSPAGATAVCGEDSTGTPTPVPLGFEGLHFFDVSDPLDPELVHSVNLSDARMETDFGRNGCGSHTATLVPDLESERLFIYNGASSANCPGTEIIEIFLDDITESDFLRFEDLGRSCHDIAVFLGEIKRGVCAGGNGFTLFRMDPNSNGLGSIVNPQHIDQVQVQGVTIGHTATFTWDGSRFVFGHEPGGGTGAACEDQDPDRNRTFWMHDGNNAQLLGTWTMSRAQGADENCTLHNINFIPTTDGSDLLVSGNYQAGTWITDWTDPASPTELAFADPPSLTPGSLTLGGAWSTYWYNGFLYETEITRGLNVFDLNDPRADAAVEFDFLNPQTQMQSIGQDVVAESTLNIKHTGSPHRFQGSVKSSEDACVAQREVVILKVRDNGSTVNVGEDVTNNDGKYFVPHNQGGAGRYQAVARSQTVTEGINTTECLRAESVIKSFNN